METPAFYANIPAYVRYDKNLDLGARLLYGELTALSNKYGYCWATNRYFAELYDVDQSTIKRWIRCLKEQGHITVEVEKTGIQTVRKIWISSEFQKMYTKGQICTPDPATIVCRGVKIELQNNTSNNTQKKKEEAAPHPPASFYIHKRVMMVSEKFDKLVEEFGIDKIKEMMESLDQYADINPKRFKTYGCHAAVIRKWIKDDASKGKKTNLKANIEENKRLAQKVMESFPTDVSNNHIQLQPKGILFCYTGCWDEIDFTDNGFKDRVLSRLRKMNLNIKGVLNE